MRTLFHLFVCIVLLHSCQEKNTQKNTYNREQEMIEFCNALGVPTNESVKVLFIPYTRCSSCQLSSQTIKNHSTSNIHIVHFNEWKGQIDNERFKYIPFGKLLPNDYGVITPYPLLLNIENDKIVSYDDLFK